jgi:phage N-6-adenine-methyltransferase
VANINACLSTGKDDWETPDALFERYNTQYHFILDAAANETNHKCPVWLGPGAPVEDAFSVEWPLHLGNIWLNPPYSRGLQSAFVRKAVAEVLRIADPNKRHNVVCLLPARTDTKLFHEIIIPNGEIEFLKGRVKFKGAPASAPFPSMIVVF